MKKIMPLIKQVMTPFPYSIEVSAALHEARRMMGEHQIHHLPVREKHHLIGVISERDVSLAYSLGTHIAEPSILTVGAVCSRTPYIVDLNTDVASVARCMSEQHLGFVLVVKDEKLAGIFTMTDCSRFLADLLSDMYGESDEPPEAA
jgi:acetoin utilization protein AcuB